MKLPLIATKTRPINHPYSRPTSFERISIELTNRCTKACWFCYDDLAFCSG